MKSLLIELLIINSIASAILVIIAKNPVISVIFLISLVLNAALFLIVKGMVFLGISYILIYLGAIVVLFLFVIMMINIKLTEILELGSQYTKNIPLALTVSGLFLYEFFNILHLNNPTSPLSFKGESSIIYTVSKDIIFTINNLFLPLDIISSGENGTTNYNVLTLLTANNWPETVLVSYTQIISLAHSLYTYGAFWFLLTSLILLLAMVAPIYLSKRT
jgi:NADH-ubiquinone oxidoreductase chain 6